MSKRIIKNAQLVNEGKVYSADVLINEGRIEKIDSVIDESGEEINGENLHLFPGVIDDQVHFREPGLTDKGCIKTESLAGVAGGTTSFMEMPNVIPPTLSKDLWDEKNQIAARDSLANYSFYMGTSNSNIDDIKAIDKTEVCGVKVFMGSSTGNLLVDDPKALEEIFTHSPVPIATHCEDTPMILEKEEKYKAKYGEDLDFGFHSEIRSREACIKSTKKAIDLATSFDAELHVLHLTTKEEVELFSDKSIEEKKITCEVCVPHIIFSQKDYEEKGPIIKCNPSIKSEEDLQALKQGLKDGRIDYLATDHAPHLSKEKKNTYFSCPSGMPSVQHSFLVALELFHSNFMNLEDIPEITSHKVAKRFKVQDRGFIREGSWADLVLVDLSKPYEVTQENVMYKCGWSPFDGFIFNSTIKETIINGETKFRDGEIISDQNGQKLIFSR